ncbi:alpha/beta fold hydrolase [Candidatus Bathyarchaeota archaeon]|nr:alpha/beta fold hydrolase [Candidatus Bathyarchaeota archaeon]
MRQKKYQKILHVAFIAGAITSAIGLNFLPAGLQRSGFTTTTIDGVNIHYNLYRGDPGAPPASKPTIVIGHGLLVNKEMMTNFAIELAARGFVVASIDWRAHGKSGGILSQEGLDKDLEAVLADLPGRAPEANMSALGMMGYSMGGYPTFRYAVNHSAVKAWVGVATAVNDDIANDSAPGNVLLVIGKFDEAFSVEEERANLANITSGISLPSDLEFDTTYGDIDGGNARRMALVRNADHLNVPWNAKFVRETTSWFVKTFNGSAAGTGMLHFYWRSLLVFVGLASLVGIVYSLAIVLSKALKITGASSKKGEMDRQDGGNKVHALMLGGGTLDESQATLKWLVPRFYGFGFLLLPTAILPALSLLTPLFFTGFMTTLVCTLAINILLMIWRIVKKNGGSIKILLKEEISTSPKVIVLSSIITVAFMAGMYLVISLNQLGIIPSVSRIGYLILFTAILFLALFIYNVFNQRLLVPILDEKLNIKNNKVKFLVVGFLSCALIYSWFLVLILVPSIIMGNYFLCMVLTLMVPIFMFFSYAGLFLEQETGSCVPNAILQAVILGFIIVTLSPFGSFLQLFA